jgi:hypothetical protein
MPGGIGESAVGAGVGVCASCGSGVSGGLVGVAVAVFFLAAAFLVGGFIAAAFFEAGFFFAAGFSCIGMVMPGICWCWADAGAANAKSAAALTAANRFVFIAAEFLPSGRSPATAPAATGKRALTLSRHGLEMIAAYTFANPPRVRVRRHVRRCTERI